ncbi:hypothetical protein BKA65DRAFT_517832 [Rhexocercosporidium sp. MPI-PUGE-AT-0058]|nr:hypothetical protein BKA65DRAFT_517832 [Rhexocercosporidium sp. MPI-PUGE-AT-0058]
MSDYPSTPSYAPGYGTRDQQNPPFLPPTYPNQYLQADDSQQGHMASHYDTSMSAYGYNRSIPSFSASAVAAGVPPLPIFTGWNQESVPLPSYTTPTNGTQYPGYTNSAQHSTPYYQTPSQPAYQQQVPGIKPYDQGDLDEGEFEENANATQTPSNGYGASQLRENGGTGYVDTAQRAVHSKARDYSPQQASYPTYNYNYSPRDSTQSRHQKSGSFSPYVPPVAAQTEHYTSYTNNSHAEDANSTPQSQHGWSQNGAGSSSRTDTQTNSYHQPQKNDAAAQQANPPPQPPSNQNTSMTNGRSVIESRKKAQAAILNLWPYDIRYQTYIDEGFSKEVVGSLFDELKMTRNSVKSVNEGSTLGGNSVGFSSIHKLGKENVPSGSSNTTSTGGLEGNNSGSNGLGKERASLSSLGNNTSSANSGGISTLHSAKAVAVPSKPAVMTEKQKTLQSKMEALRKSREERAQKAAAKVDNKASSAGVDVPIPQAAPTKVPLSHPSTSPSPLSTSPVPIAQLQVDKPSTSTSPAPPINVTQPASLIPGLFLASTSGSAPTSLPSNMSSSNLSNIRKRPVAADFDEATPISTPFKRPFGHSRSDQRLVITVSDDEGDSDDEDVAMDLESQATQDSPTQSARKMSDQRSAAIQNLPPLSNFPPRKLYTPPPNSSAANTPPIQGAPNTAGRLTHVQSEMEKLKKQIALREARQRAKQASSGSRTPQVSEANEPRTNVSNPPATSIASKVESSIKMQEMIETAAANVALDQQRLAEAQAAEVQKAAELKKSEDEQKRLRREELAADIPRVDAEVQQNQSRLELLRAEMAKIEASVQKSLEDKRLLAEEMERLGQEAEDQLQVQKDKLEDLNRQESTISEDPARPPSYGLVTEASDAASLDHSSIPTTATTAQPTREDVAGSVQPSAINSDLPRMELPRSPQVNGNEVTSGNPNPVSSPAENHSSETLAETKDQEVSKENSSTDQALEAALQEAVRAEVDSHGKVEDDMDIEDFYAPDPSQLTPQTPGHVREQIRSPEYSPTLDRTVPDAPQHESDDYEPPEATPPIDAQFAPDSPPFSPAPPEIVSEVADDENLNVDMPEFEPAPAANDVEQVHSEENLPSTNGSFPPQVVEERTVAVDKPETFTPYESPLKKFRAYRFHPNFKQDVSGGLKSKTYSHKIDVMNEFCRFELAGGICNDPTCDSQHFRDIGLPDDAVLTALGSPEEFKGEQRDRFCAGLRRVLLDLRLRKIRDFDVIASEIIAHRANFLGDKSKVLAALEGTTI